MGRRRYNLKIDQGADYSLSVVWRLPDGTPKDLTGFSARLQIRKAFNSPSPMLDISDSDAITLGGGAGTIDVALLATDTSDLETGVWDLKMTSPEGAVKRLLMGKAIVSPQVTRVGVGGGGGDGPTLTEITAGLTPFWADACADADPIAAGKYHGASVQTVDVTGNAIEYPDDLSSPHAMETEPVPRFAQFPGGGASGGGRYHFYAPQGDDIYSDGTKGRASLDYPKYDPGGSPPHIGPEDGSDNIGLLYEGRRVVTAFATRLRTGAVAPERDWDLDLRYPVGHEDEGYPVWRLLAQWKRNEWYNVSDPEDSPALSFEQKDNLYVIRNLGATAYSWEVDALGSLDRWTRWAADITFSQDPAIGKFRIFGDFNNDGFYEYDSGDVLDIQTLSLGSNVIETGLPAPVAARFPAEGIESFFSLGMYEGFGGDSLEVSDPSLHGTPGG